MRRSRGCSARSNGPRRTPTELQRKAVLYVNSDGNARGFLSAAGSHSLQRLVNEVAQGREGSADRRQREGAPAMRAAWWTGYDKDASSTDKDAAQEGARGRGLQARRARLGLGLHAVPAAPRAHHAEHRLWRRGRHGRRLSLQLRLVRSLRAVRRSGLRVRRGRGADGRPAGPAHRERRRAADGVRQLRRHDRRAT